jgi:hypothetical protein
MKTNIGQSLTNDNVGIGIVPIDGLDKLQVQGGGSFTSDIKVNNITVGKGGGNIASNTAIGYRSLFNNTTGIYNVAIGTQALQANTSGISNNSIGYRALLLNTTGSNNVANGFESLYNNTTGSNNIANGWRSLYSNTTGNQNTSTGSQSLYSNTTGNQNTSTGSQSLYSNTTGSQNIANGLDSGRFIADKTTAATILNSSIMIGTRTSPLADNQTNQIVIGHDAIGLGSNTSVLGNSSTVAARIWGRNLIGTSVDNGTDALQVEGSAKLSYLGIGIATSFARPLSIKTSSGGTCIYIKGRSNADDFAGIEFIKNDSDVRNALIAANSTGLIFQGAASFNSTIAATSFNGGAALTGTPTAPTATAGTNTTQIATTAFVQATKPYKVYTALLSQSGTDAPVATVLENTLGGAVVWSRNLQGVYFATLNGAFIDNKTFGLSGNNVVDGQAVKNIIQRNTDNQIVVETYFNTTKQDGILNKTSIEIRVYN